MVISAPVNNSAYVTNTHAEVNKFDSTADNVDQRVNAVVEDDNPQSSLKIAERLSERSEQPAWQQKNQEGELASLQSTKRVLTNMENVANQLNEAIEVEDSEKVSQLRAQLKELTAQLNSSQSDESKSKADSEGDEVKVKFNSSEMSSIAETLAKTDLTNNSAPKIKKLLSGDGGLMSQITQVRNELDARVQEAFTANSAVDTSAAIETSQASKESMLDASGAKQLNGTNTSADITVSILG